jgi:hypothetical protein
MNTIRLLTRSLSLSLILFFSLSACGNIGQKLEDNLDAINRSVEGLDSLANDKMDRVQRLDTLVDKKMQKLERMDSLVNQTRSRLDSLQILN